MSALSKIAMGLALLLSVGVQAEEAPQEKVLRLYNWSDYFAPDTLSEFTRETGIRVIYDVMDSSETLEAKLMAGRSGMTSSSPGHRGGAADAGGQPAAARQGQAATPGGHRPRPGAVAAGLSPCEEAVVPYTWGTIGLTYNADAIRQRMPDAPVNSLDMLFKPELAAKFADCGISVIDSPDEVLAVVLHYLGRDPRSGKADDLGGPGPAQGDQALYPQVPVPAGDSAGERGSLPLPGLQRRHDPGQARRRRGGKGSTSNTDCRRREHHLDGHHGDPGGCPILTMPMPLSTS
jgi:hypothetical protein